MKSWEEYGVYFGYPLCCVEFFCAEDDAISRVERGDWWGTGFVPCPRCNEQIKVQGFKDFVLKEITPRRKCKKPFPLGNAR